jgi:hypothetical protein
LAGKFWQDPVWKNHAWKNPARSNILHTGYFLAKSFPLMVPAIFALLN